MQTRRTNTLARENKLCLCMLFKRKSDKMKCIKQQCKLWNKSTNGCGEQLKYAVDEICVIEHQIIWHRRKIEELGKHVSKIADNQ